MTATEVGSGLWMLCRAQINQQINKFDGGLILLVRTFTMHFCVSTLMDGLLIFCVKCHDFGPDPHLGARRSASTHLNTKVDVFMNTSGNKKAADSAYDSSEQTSVQALCAAADSETNSDGRCSGFLTREQFSADTYKLRFDTADYFQRIGGTTFYPYVEVRPPLDDSVFCRYIIFYSLRLFSR